MTTSDPMAGAREEALTTVWPLSDGDRRTIGQYTALGRLRADRRGVVYLAQSEVELLVCVRVLDPMWMREPANLSALSRSLVAARRADKASCTARILSSHVEDSLSFVVTEYVAGPLLLDMVRQQGPLREVAVSQLSRQILAGLHVLHRANVVYQNLSPLSVVVGSSGPRFLDVGLSEATCDVDGDAESPDGARFYWAPEQCAGEGVNPATDMFAWAATVAFASGGISHSGSEAQQEPQPHGHSWAADLRHLPTDLATVVEECLNPDPTLRPTARRVLERLEPQPAALPADDMPTFPPPSSDAQGASVGVRSARASVTSPPAVTGHPGAVGRSSRRRTRVPLMAHLSRLRRPASAFGRSVGLRLDRLWIALVAVILAISAISLLSSGGTGGPARQPSPRVVATADSASRECLRPRTPHEVSARVWNVAEGCYGFSDSSPGFGRDVLALSLQDKIFSQNPPAAVAGITIIWFGSLTCPSYRPDGTCSDGRIYESERQELQGLMLAQRRPGVVPIRVVVANVGADVTHFEEVARLIAEHRASFGRVVAAGGVESRQETRRAIGLLLQAGIPFIGVSLSADLATPDTPFLDQPGYLQLSPPNRRFANATISLIARHTPPGTGRQVIIYHAPVPGDEYTESLALDEIAAARENPRTHPQEAMIVSSVSQLPRSVCRSTATPTATPAAALIYVDRWTAFRTFADGLSALCGSGGPALLVSSDSVNRLMTNDAARTAVNAPWPMAYFRKGKQCGELEAAASDNPSGEASQFLGMIRDKLGTCAIDESGAGKQIGERVAMMWDAVTMAINISSTGPLDGDPRDVSLALTSGTIIVRGGQVVSYADFTQPLCVLTVDRSRESGRSVDNCDTAFGVVR